MTEIAFRSLGNSTLSVSIVGIGCNNFGRPHTMTESQEGTTSVIDRVIELGITFLDTADTYGRVPGLSETLLGVALKGRRDQVVLATKFGHSGYDLPGASGWGPKGSRGYIRNAIDASLARLQTDHIDLYQMHTPDDQTPIEETLGALEELVVEGKIRFYGNSNFSAEQIFDANASAHASNQVGFVSVQNEYSLLARSVEDAVLPTAKKLGLGFLPYFPLHNGLLTGKFSREGGPADSRIVKTRKYIHENAPWDTLEALEAFCRDRGITLLMASFAWLLAQAPVASVIAGVTKPEQVEANALAAVSWRPPAEDIATLSEIVAS